MLFMRMLIGLKPLPVAKTPIKAMWPPIRDGVD